MINITANFNTILENWNIYVYIYNTYNKNRNIKKLKQLDIESVFYDNVPKLFLMFRALTGNVKSGVNTYCVLLQV